MNPTGAIAPSAMAVDLACQHSRALVSVSWPALCEGLKKLLEHGRGSDLEVTDEREQDPESVAAVRGGLAGGLALDLLLGSRVAVRVGSQVDGRS